ncbi:HlyD family efflux transporter periplasmic adaptor subunit [Thalassospira xianhensis]|uniref:Peptidase M50 n=1 Tax=Thalassospira xianhensis MCCC 1A02616 TaxID=1177929 RepID=A0A367UH40_9PROT|nr:site-2 protease family protein [Thalassospira xianhensis]RCK07479.1 peptidase M50 [Thalassospira xianhensis MCCC 1A02616]
MQDDADQTPRPLREDLRLCEAGQGMSGEPAWMIQDTVLNRFYKIGWLEFECLRWWGRTPRQIHELISRRTALKPDLDQIIAFVQFLKNHHLLRPTPAETDALGQKNTENGWMEWRWWLHHYLFFRIPLVRPQKHLTGLLGLVGWIFHRLTALLIVFLTVTGIVMVSQQWDSFTHAVVESFSGAGIISFAIALIVAKTLHELGHALVATRLGLRVAHMGVAFVVLWPMLYTDTSETWKLRSPKQRLAISSAGILTELALAGLATFGWAICEDGATRNALLYLATTSWVLSLALNVSPFMRFDGYFILSDILDFPNLHERASAIAQVTMRRSLLGLDEDWPEPFPKGQRRMLATFAFMTWAYRFVLFLGIAVAVYLLFFKVLGIFLFIVEICWFILLPVIRELKHWWANRKSVPVRRRVVFGAIFLGILILAAIPWQSQIHGNGVLRAERQLKVFAPFPALLSELRTSGPAASGDVLLQLDDPDLHLRMRNNEASITSYKARLGGMMADPMGLSQKSVIEQRLAVQFREITATQAEIARLTLRAPFDGQWLDVDHEMRPGQWIGDKEPLGILVDPTSWQIDGYVHADEIERLSVGNRVLFYPDGKLTPIPGQLIAIGSTRVRSLSHPLLASTHGGPIATASEKDGLSPKAAWFEIRVQLDDVPPDLREMIGHLQIDGQQRSLLIDSTKHLIAILLRESGF